MYINRIIKYFILAWLISSCSAQQVKIPSQLIASNETNILFELRQGITIKALYAEPTFLKTGTRWTKVGIINQGSVFRTKDQVVIVNSFNVHGGYIVVNKDAVVGYYLPIEKTFVETKPVIIKLSKMEF